jgi:para-aminobenzoate synthetase component 1
MLSWAKQFNIFCFLDNQQYNMQPHVAECLLAAGVDAEIETADLASLDRFFKGNDRGCFGHLSYDLKNAIHALTSDKESKITFPDCYFFAPKHLLSLKDGALHICSEHANDVHQSILQQPEYSMDIAPVHVQQRLTKDEYIRKIKSLQAHIQQGDCYEINFCQEFFCENIELDPFAVFQKLMEVSPNPFSAMYRVKDNFLVCASPERFLQRSHQKLIAQPMKGTIKRNPRNIKADEQLKAELQRSRKEQSENVMIVDLMRNDLSRVCEPHSVHVDELFGIYSFPQVHQMISTISGRIKEDVPFSKVMKACFPMGSMTGAPKYRVMELIDKYEDQKRGIYSGALGYVHANGDFDFNVVIRSIAYNQKQKYLSYQVGSGITAYSHPESEWEECLLKAEGIQAVLGKRVEERWFS